MKKNLHLFISGLIAITFLFSSCKSFTNLSIEKRQHRGGYYVDWGNGKVKTDPVKNSSAGVKHARESQKNNTVTPIVSKPEVKRISPAAFEQDGPHANHPSESSEEKSSYSRNSFKVKEEPVALSENASKKVIRSYSFNDSFKEGSSGNTPDWLLAVLCIFIPPLAVFLSEGIGQAFWIDLVLALLGIGALATGFLGLFWLAAIVYAFVVIF